MNPSSTGGMIRVGFWGAFGAACFYGLVYLGAAGLVALADASRPKAKTSSAALVKKPCGCGCGG